MEPGIDVLLTNFFHLFFLATAPFTLLVGIFLLYDINTYLRIEKFLAKNYGPIRKTVIGVLEKNRESLQLFLLKQRRIIGTICILNALFAFLLSATLFKKL